MLLYDPPMYSWSTDFRAASVSWRGKDFATLAHIGRRWYVVGNAGFAAFNTEEAARAAIRVGIFRAEERLMAKLGCAAQRAA